MSSAVDLPINCVARNSVWVYPRRVESRFPGGLEIVEMKRSHVRPDFALLPDGAQVSVELYGGAVTLRLDGDKARVYVERFVWVGFESEERAREEFDLLWGSIERLDSLGGVESRLRAWLGERRGGV